MERTYLKRKAVDDVLGGEDSWKNVDSTEGKNSLLCFSSTSRTKELMSFVGCLTVDCPKECGSDRAFFMQIQIRSADEPSTTFYK